MHRYLTRHAYGNATSDDLRQAVLDATGQSLDWFWDAVDLLGGYPASRSTPAYDTAARALTLTVRQTQPDTATADSTGLRYATPLVVPHAGHHPRRHARGRCGAPRDDQPAGADAS